MEKTEVNSVVIADSRESDRRVTRLDEELEAGLLELAEQGRRRALREIRGELGPRMRVDGRDVWMLAGANYLDLAADPRVVRAGRSALVEHGAAAGGARLISGNLPVHEQLEQELARWLGCP